MTTYQKQEMATYLKQEPVVGVWVTLILLTGVSWWLGTGHSLGMDSVTAATAVMIIVLFAKTHLVGMYFMELRHAIAPLQRAFHTWTVLACGVVLGLYLWT